MLIRSSGTGCPACGVHHASCGPAGTGNPVDLPIRKDRAMGDTRKYHVTHNGHKTIMRLNDADVKQYPNAKPVDGDALDTETTDAEAKTRTAANKARRPAANKQRE